ncbi:MAG: hypothetical protein JXX29_23085 [Deltaproteobacteria bacterium]|nr:hypothetical protein [Deltaproteobacteria bacterium]MBN2674585.1 hypothetical protein [Deltaproteobacteria bacterium]
MNAEPKTTPKHKRPLFALATTYEPWPLGTDAMFRILAWPDYDNPSQLQKVLQASSRLFDNPDGCLILRYDKSLDGSIENVVQRVNTALARRGDQGELNILIVDDDIPESQWYRVGLTAFCAVGFKDDKDSVRHRFIIAQHGEKLFV